MFKKAVLVEIEEFAFDKKYWDQLDKLVESRVSLQRDDPKLKDELKDCDCLLLGFQIDVQKDVIDAAPGLKYIGVLATAFGTIDIEYAAEKGIPVTNLAGYSTDSVAEFTVAAILWHIRSIEEGRARVSIGDYSFDGIKAREIRNSNFGVIGLGDIGNRVAELAEGFGANVSYWNRSKKDSKFEAKELEDLLSSSDFISINVAEAPETINLINAGNVSKIKAGAVIMSTVPPAVVNTDAIAGRVAKGGVVYISDHPDEMEKADLAKIKDLDNVKLFGPIGFLSDEARINKQEIFIGNMKAALDGKPENKVN